MLRIKYFKILNLRYILHISTIAFKSLESDVTFIPNIMYIHLPKSDVLHFLQLAYALVTL